MAFLHGEGHFVTAIEQHADRAQERVDVLLLLDDEQDFQGRSSIVSA